MRQRELFEPAPVGPDGFRYQAECVAPELEERLLGQFADLPFKEFEFHGYLGKRRVVSFGHRYDYGRRAVLTAEPMPAFLLPLREIAGGFSGLPAGEFRQALVT